MGQVFNLEEDSIGAVIFGDYLEIKEGDSVKSTGRLLEVAVGDALIGRVVDPLGVPLDGGPAIQTTETRKMDIIAPGKSGLYVFFNEGRAKNPATTSR